MLRGKNLTPSNWLALLFLGTYFSCLGQISGIVKDAKTDKPLEGVEVFLDQHTGISLTNVEGHFELTEAVSGFVTVSLYKSGYELYHSSMRIQPGKAYKLNLTLTPEKRRESGSVRQTFSDDIQTGYRIVTYDDQSVRKKRLTRFELLSDINVQQQIEWEKKRKEVYEGSLQHWLTALVGGTSKEEGFEMYVDSDQVAPEALVAKTTLPDYFRLQVEKPLEVKYGGQINKLTALGTLDVSQQGVLLNDDLLKIEGPMSVQRLPLNYVPFAGDIEVAYEETIKRYYEKVYVHTDKPYYYQGEPMWFKVYMNYYDRSMRDSLSKVLYVELISPDREIVLEKMLKIDSGMAHGDFILPDTLKRGDYFLRAYTNLQRNFGESNLYVKDIPILGITDKVDPTQAEWEPKSDGRVKITTDKEKYGTRDRITMRIEVIDEAGNPVDANLSVSVTDASQVVPIKMSSIEDNYAVDNEEIDIPQMLRYPAEEGITMKGVYFNEKGQPAQALLNLVQWRSSNVALVETQEDGRFEVTGFDFYDSTRVFYKNGDKERGKIILDKKDKPKFVLQNRKALDVRIVDSNAQQRIISEYEVPKEARLLDEVVIEDKPIEVVGRVSTYGEPDFVLKQEQIRKEYPNIMYSMAGTVPGLKVEPGPTDGIVFFWRSQGLSVQNGGEPMILLDDVPVGNDAGVTLSLIDPNTVERVEFSKRINVLYGTQGVNGVISIFTKKNLKKAIIDPDFKELKLAGFDTPREFRLPDYSKKKSPETDYRSGLYWNASFKINTESNRNSVSFYSADLETTYKVVVEGVTSNNEPICAEKFITISND